MKNDLKAYYEGIKFWEWIVAFVFSMVMVLTPAIIFSKLSGQYATTGHGTVVVVVFGLLIAIFLQDRRLHKGRKLNSFQKIAIAVFILVLLVDIIAISITFTPFFSEENRKIRFFEEDYVSTSNYYLNAFQEIGEEIDAIRESQDNNFVVSKYDELKSLSMEFMNKTLDFCSRAEKEDINLEGSEIRDTLGIICSDKDLFIKCETKAAIGPKRTIEFLLGGGEKTKKECLEVQELVTFSDDCLVLYEGIGENVTSMEPIIEPICNSLDVDYTSIINTDLTGKGRDTLKLLDRKTYLVKGMYYEFYVLYLGRNGVEFDINGEDTDTLNAGDEITLPGGAILKILNIYHDDYDFYVDFSLEK